MAIEGLAGELELSTRVLNLNLDARGELGEGQDGNIHWTLESLGNMPAFLFPILLELLKHSNHNLSRAVTVHGNTLSFNPELSLPPESKVRLIIGSQSLAAESS